jgi:DeoR/GlpR family transcriptional regulator of sugar metabolism
MLPTERRQRIVALLRERREVSVQALCRELETPAASIRRDLRELEATGRITRRHGKAVYRPTLMPQSVQPEAPIDDALLEELVAETQNVLDEARNLFLTGGPVLQRVVPELSGKTILTHDLKLALAAAQSNNDVALIGRDVDNQTLCLKPQNLEEELKDYWFDIAVIEADGIDGRNVFVSHSNHGFLRAVKQRCDSLVVLGKSPIMGARGARVAAPLTDVDVLLIDSGISEETGREVEHAGVELRKAGQGEQRSFDINQVGNVVVFKRLKDRPFDRAKPAEFGEDEL